MPPENHLGNGSELGSGDSHLRARVKYGAPFSSQRVASNGERPGPLGQMPVQLRSRCASFSSQTFKFGSAAGGKARPIVEPARFPGRTGPCDRAISGPVLPPSILVLANNSRQTCASRSTSELSLADPARVTSRGRATRLKGSFLLPYHSPPPSKARWVFCPGYAKQPGNEENQNTRILTLVCHEQAAGEQFGPRVTSRHLSGDVEPGYPLQDASVGLLNRWN
jgi:hypothetical protein